MKNLLLIFATLYIVSACYPVETTSHYNKDLTRAHSESDPIYLSFSTNKNGSFYFILSRDSNHSDYKLRVRWHVEGSKEPLFNGYDSTLKFLVNNTKILTFKPISRPKIVAFNMNANGYEEEAKFAMTRDEFYSIAYAKEVSVELTGKFNSVIGKFNRRNSLKAFRNFAEKSH